MGEWNENKLDEVAKAVVEKTAELVENAAGKAAEIGAAVISKASEAADAMQDKAAAGSNSDFIEKAVKEAETAAQKIAETAGNVLEKAAEAADELTKKAAAFGEAAVQKAADFAEDLAGKASDAAEDAAEKAADPVGETADAAENTEEKAAAPEEPTESMADYDDQITASFRPIHEGDILTGTVIGISDDEVVLDFGTYTDGVVKLKDASDDPNFSFHQLEMGQKLTGTVIRRDNGEGRLQLSLKEASALLAWDRLRQLMADKSPIDVKISGIVKGGAVAYVEGVRGFIPASKLSLEYVEDLDQYLGKSIQVQVITADEENKRLVMSARELLREKEAEEKKKRISNVAVGLVTEGKVESIKPYGAFIDLGKGMSGLLHISQISNQRIKHPSAVLQEGQTVKVKVIGVKDGKISLSMKALEDVAAEEVTEETYELPKSEEVTTSLASFFKNIKL